MAFIPRLMASNVHHLKINDITILANSADNDARKMECASLGGVNDGGYTATEFLCKYLKYLQADVFFGSNSFDILVPLLFIVYFNDLTSTLSQCFANSDIFDLCLCGALSILDI